MRCTRRGFTDLARGAFERLFEAVGVDAIRGKTVSDSAAEFVPSSPSDAVARFDVEPAV